MFAVSDQQSHSSRLRSEYQWDGRGALSGICYYRVWFRIMLSDDGSSYRYRYRFAFPPPWVKADFFFFNIGLEFRFPGNILQGVWVTVALPLLMLRYFGWRFSDGLVVLWPSNCSNLNLPPIGAHFVPVGLLVAISGSWNFRPAVQAHEYDRTVAECR